MANASNSRWHSCALKLIGELTREYNRVAAMSRGMLFSKYIDTFWSSSYLQPGWPRCFPSRNFVHFSLKCCAARHSLSVHMVRKFSIYKIMRDAQSFGGRKGKSTRQNQESGRDVDFPLMQDTDRNVRYRKGPAMTHKADTKAPLKSEQHVARTPANLFSLYRRNQRLCRRPQPSCS